MPCHHRTNRPNGESIFSRSSAWSRRYRGFSPRRLTRARLLRTHPTQAMAFLWTRKPPVPDRAPTDDVVPVYRFDDVLDLEKLRPSLVQLMQIGNWRKVGARLRRNVVHLPIFT